MLMRTLHHQNESSVYRQSSAIRDRILQRQKLCITAVNSINLKHILNAHGRVSVLVSSQSDPYKGVGLVPVCQAICKNAAH